MAELRLIALMLIAVGCRESEAGAGSGLSPPAGWTALPALASAAKAAASGIAVSGSEAWGDPGRGCYAAWLAARGDGGAVDRMVEQLLASVRAEPALAGVVVRDVIKPVAGTDPGMLALAFDHPRYRGKLRARLARDGTIALLACFWSAREPAACDRSCTLLLGSMK